MSYGTITPAEFAARLNNGEQLNLIDVREEDEHAIARIEAAQLMPLSRIQEWVGNLNPDDEIVVMCHHGIRSAQVCALLARSGYAKLNNLAGGIDRWAREVDATVPLY
jgi:rhodanese-related sulfurtransferase